MPSRFVFLLSLLFAMPLIAISGLLLTKQFNHKNIQILGELSPFTLTERNGSKVNLTDLRGQLWVADFIFTRCSGQCSLLSQQMKSLQKKLRFNGRIKLVSITVDPEHDSPDQLKTYAAGFDADPSKWLFLTGPRQQIFRLLRESFKVSATQPTGGEEILHSDKLVLIDELGRIRGYYASTEDGAIKSLLTDVKQLTRELKTKERL